MASNSSQYEALADQIDSVLQGLQDAPTINEATRHRLVGSSRKLSVFFEKPRETERRIGYAACTTSLSRLRS
jgi:hypothetical protein